MARTASSGLKSPREKLSLLSHTVDGVILIDGTRAHAAALHRLDPKDIVSVEVIKGAQALQMLRDPPRGTASSR